MSTSDIDVTMNDLKIKFDGSASEIEANTLINNLLHFTNIVQEVNKDLNTSRKVNIKIQATEKGSFIVHLVIETSIIESLKNLLSNDTVQYASGLVTVVGGVYAVAKFLKKEKGEVVKQQGDNVTIKNSSGNITIINANSYNIYNDNRIVRSALSQEFRTLEADENITGFEISNANNVNIVDIRSDEFLELSEIDETPSQATYRTIRKEGMLNIFKIVFDDASKWEFYYDGNKISARITDAKFFELVNKGESFAKGDSFRAEIEIYQLFDTAVNAYINKSYTVSRIIEHIPRADQGKLFDL